MKCIYDYLVVSGKRVREIRTAHGLTLLGSHGTVPLSETVLRGVRPNESLEVRSDIANFLRSTLNSQRVYFNPFTGQMRLGSLGRVGVSWIIAQPHFNQLNGGVLHSYSTKILAVIANMVAGSYSLPRERAGAAQRMIGAQGGTILGSTFYHAAIRDDAAYYGGATVITPSVSAPNGEWTASALAGNAAFVQENLPIGWCVSNTRAERDPTIQGSPWGLVLWNHPAPVAGVVTLGRTSSNSHNGVSLSNVSNFSDQHLARAEWTGPDDASFKAFVSLLGCFAMGAAEGLAALAARGIGFLRNVGAPDSFGSGWLATDIVVHGALTIPTTPVEVRDELWESWDALVAARPVSTWWVSRPAADAACAMSGAAMGRVLRSSTYHDLHAQHLTGTQRDEMNAAALELEASGIMLQIQTHSQGILARRLQSWHSDFSDLSDSYVLDKKSGYKVGDFNRKWPGRREHAFVLAAREMIDTENNMFAVRLSEEKVVNGVTTTEWYVVVGTASAVYDTRVNAPEDIADIAGEYANIYTSSTGAATIISEYFQERGVTSEDFHQKIIARPDVAGPSLISPFFGYGDEDDETALRFLTIKAPENREMLTRAIETLEMERASAKLRFDT